VALRTPAQWLGLKPATRHRYTNALAKAGIADPEAFYLSGARLNVARSHSIAPEHPERTPYVDDSHISTAERLGIALWVPDWAELPRARQAQIARIYANGRYTKWSGRKLTPREHRERGLHKSDHRVLRMPSIQQSKDMIAWDILMVKYRGEGWGHGYAATADGPVEDWTEFKIQYMNTFGSAAA
jgi:hypothetical protein